MTPAALASIIDQLRRLALHLELAAREVETLRKDLERLFGGAANG